MIKNTLIKIGFLAILSCGLATSQQISAYNVEDPSENARPPAYLKEVCDLLFYPLVKSDDCAFIPVTFDRGLRPIVAMEIEGMSYPLLLDLGSYAQMSLEREIVAKVNNKPHGIARFIDFKGNFYESPNYLIPEIKIGDITFREVISHEVSDAFHRNTIIWQHPKAPPSKRNGAIGRALLKGKNIFLDFPHSRIAFIDAADPLKDPAFPVEGTLRVPFELTSDGIVLTIGTDRGEKKFVLDSGCSITAIRASHDHIRECQKNEHGVNYFISSQFVMAGKDFRNMQIYFLDITSEMGEIDGLLGMDFLCRHAMYIDFQKKIIYIG